MPRFRRTSIFGAGPRRPLDREQRARFRYIARTHRAAGRLAACHHDVAEALLRRLGVDGRLDPSQDTLAEDAMCDPRTVRRALDRLRGLGLVHWHQRIVRSGWRVVQTSNAYVLLPVGAAALPVPVPGRRALADRRAGKAQEKMLATADGQEADRSPLSPAEVAAAQEALARRRAVIEVRLAARYR